MTHPKPDLEKLEVREDLLKSFIMSSLEEEGTSVPVMAPTTGDIITWVKKFNEKGERVLYYKEGEAICLLKAERVDEHISSEFKLKRSRNMFLHAPDEGILIILVEEGKVFEGMTIAVILPRSHFTKPTPPTE